jgi:[NiFe] hydrogenase assembly HybE family chaperone
MSESPGPTDPLGAQLLGCWRAVGDRMASLPIFNPTLEFQTTAFRRSGEWRVGVVTTPWFMNVVAVPDRPELVPTPGATIVLQLPGEAIEATAGELAGFGCYAAASLFSPMDDFVDPETTAAVAAAALEALFRAQTPAETPKIERRQVLFGRATTG